MWCGCWVTRACWRRKGKNEAAQGNVERTLDTAGQRPAPQGRRSGVRNEQSVAVSDLLCGHLYFFHQFLRVDFPMWMPFAMGWSGSRVQYPRHAWTSLSLVQPRAGRLCDRNDRDVRAAVGDRDAGALELAGTDRRRRRDVSPHGPDLRPVFWLGRFVLETLVLADSLYFLHTWYISSYAT